MGEYSKDQISWGIRADCIMAVVSTPFLLFPQLIWQATIIVVLITITTWIAYHIRLDMQFFPSSPITSAFMVLVLSCLLGSLASADIHLTWQDAPQVFLGLVWWRVFALHITTQRHLFFGVATFLVFGIVISLSATLMVSWPSKVDSLQPITTQLPTGVWLLPDNVSGNLINSNSLAATLLLFAPMLCAIALTHIRTHTILFVSVSLIAIACYGILLLTQSRGGYVAGTIGLASLFFVRAWQITESKASRWLLLVLISFIPTSLVLMVVIGQIQLDFLYSLWLDPPDNTAVGSLGTLKFRQEVWQWAVIAISDFPLTGTGFGAFRTVVHRLYPTAIPITYDIGHAHNQWLQVALDLGIFGLVAYNAILVAVGWMCLQIMRSPSNFQVVGLGGGITLFGFHVWGLSDSLSLGAKPMLLFWMLIGLITAGNKLVLQAASVTEGHKESVRTLHS